jgi:hypothetical protein
MPEQILQGIYDSASANRETSFIDDRTIRERVDYVSRCTSNRAGVLAFDGSHDLAAGFWWKSVCQFDYPLVKRPWRDIF